MKKQVYQVLKSSRRHWVGNGFNVSSVFSYSSHGKTLSPFLLLDYAAPTDFPGDGTKRGVEAHPHKGFETVTIAYQGEVAHRDSSGGGGTIGAGDVQWMTAGAGIIHEEFHSENFSRTGGTFEMVQLWVNLPARFKGEAPHYQTLLKADIPVVTLDDAGSTLRVIAGNYGQHTGPASTYTAINLWDVKAAAGGAFTLTPPAGHTSGLLVLEGAVNINDSTAAVAGDFVVFAAAGDEVAVSVSEDSKLLFLTGEPIDEPIVGHGPFVMNTDEEIAQAFQQFRSGQMGTLVEA